MKLKTKAVVAIALRPVRVALAMLFRFHMYNIMAVTSSTTAPRQKHVRAHMMSSFRYVANASDHLRARECTPTTVMLPSVDFTTDGIMDNIDYTISKQGKYNVVLPNQKKEKLYQNTVDKNEDEKLTVIVVPHSPNGHSDLLPFDQFYEQKSKHTLDRIVQKLSQYKDMSFIWTETASLSRWWLEQNDATRQQIRKLIRKGQLEIVNGGWVVPDEACTDYHDVIQQMIEGHRWLYNTLGVKPRVNWAVKPFGHSQTMPYLWKLAGFNLMVVGSVHEAVREYLRQRIRLQFSWRQMWDPRGDTDIITQILPYISSATRHSCGPDTTVCSRFDFLKSPPISEVLREDDPDFVVMASALYEQYRLTANASPRKTIFIPIGGESGWTKDSEWDNNYRSYQKLFKYMNSRSDWNISVRFGTMTHYFDFLKGAQHDVNPTLSLGSTMPAFSGDFLPYSQSDNTYWTGFYSSRPWIKYMSREVDAALRTADILHVMACIQSPFDVGLQEACRQFTEELRTARQSVALFQKYDAITGTSRPGVVDDYKKKLLQAMRSTQLVVNWAVPVLMLTDLTQTVNMFPATRLPYGMTLSWPPTAAVRISPTRSVNVVLFNPLPIDRLETVTIRINDSTVAVSQGNKDINVQILPVLSAENIVNSSVFDATFNVMVPALGMETVRLYRNDSSLSKTQLSDISIKKSAHTIVEPSCFRAEPLPTFREIILENNCLKLEFEGRTGLLKEVLDKMSGRRTTVDMDFVKYTPYKGNSRVFQARLEAESFADYDKLNVFSKQRFDPILSPGPPHSFPAYNTFVSHRRGTVPSYIHRQHQ
ncbi:alpha-mannosidase 2-like [Liolophura sinensis]|uniref:alpha-mannosidase 2-like n=1 Tax=Liolophura sinensis TaxID=3198878 RepID=UPI003158552E